MTAHQENQALKELIGMLLILLNFDAINKSKEYSLGWWEEDIIA